MTEQVESDEITVGNARLLTGRAVSIALAAPDDLARVRWFYEHLDDVAMYDRFFGIRRQIPDSELRSVVGATLGHVTLLASMDGRLIGIGEYIIGANPTEAEVAFAVADDHHREGIATLLLERLAVIAHDRGLLRFTAAVLPHNGDMQLVFRTVGLTTRSRFYDGVMTVSLDLTSVDAMFAAAARRRPRHPRVRTPEGERSS